MLKLTIAIPNYNGGEKLRQAVKSCKHIKLSPDNFEILIVDNKSEDNSLQIIQELKNEFSNLVIYKNRNNVGRIQNWNVCIENCSGKYLIFLFTNDTINKNNNIAQVINDLDLDDSISIVMSPLIRKGENKEFLKKFFFPKQVKCSSNNFTKQCLRRGLLPFGPIQAIIYRTEDILALDNKFLGNFPINADEIFSYVQATYRKYILFNPQPQIVWDLTQERFHGKMKFEDEFNEHAKTIDEISKKLNLKINNNLISTYRFINFLKYSFNNIDKKDNKKNAFISLMSQLRKNKAFFTSDKILAKTFLEKIKNPKIDADDILFKIIISYCMNKL